MWSEIAVESFFQQVSVFIVTTWRGYIYEIKQNQFFIL